MFIHKVTVRLKDTDATGGIYFTEQLRMAQEAFECFLEKIGFSVDRIFSSGFALPIVHVESDYFSALTLGDEVQVSMALKNIGTTSITLVFSFIRKDQEVGRATIVHVAIDRLTGKKIQVPNELFECLGNLQLVS